MRSPGEPLAPAGVDVTTPNVARIYDYLLGGNDNFAADREAAERILAVVPEARPGARGNRAFVGRTVWYIAARGVRQFLDIGCGLPTQRSVHQLAATVIPGARVIYVDNDPVVIVHGWALLAGTGGAGGPARAPGPDRHAGLAQQSGHPLAIDAGDPGDLLGGRSPAEV